jgi:hypothetical protein
MTTAKKVAAGAALGMAVPAAVGVAKKLLENGKRKQRRGSRSGASKAEDSRTKEQLYDEAKRLDIEGRSNMTKAQLERAINRARS